MTCFLGHDVTNHSSIRIIKKNYCRRPDEKNKKRTKNLIFEYQKHSEDQNILSPGLSVQPKQEIINTPKSDTTDSINMNENEVLKLEQQNINEALKQEQQIEVQNIRKYSSESELESVPKDITEKVDVAQNLDLFKAVFLSSSESEDEDDVTNKETSDTHKIEELKANILSDSLIPKIKPIKEGILSNVNFHKFSNPKKDIQEHTKSETSTSLNTNEIKEEIKVISYGPALPTKKVEITKTITEITLSTDSEDLWVEKCDNDKKAKHKKKHKKDKHKKHKRNKKSRN